VPEIENLPINSRPINDSGAALIAQRRERKCLKRLRKRGIRLAA